jgi:hypothetical protein
MYFVIATVLVVSLIFLTVYILYWRQVYLNSYQHALHVNDKLKNKNYRVAI